MARYMRFVAPFLGIGSDERRRLLRRAWSELPAPTSSELGTACLALMKQPQREFHYSVADLITRFIDATDEYFLDEYVTTLLTTKSWWDTVDGIGTAAVSPLCWRYDASRIILEWSASDNIWLIRAAIQHQRGWKRDTDVAFVLDICRAHVDSAEFFIAKAIGWALRDIARFDPTAVRRFLEQNAGLSPVAVREANRTLTG